MSESSGASADEGNGKGRGDGRLDGAGSSRGAVRREGWRDALARAPHEALIEELRERDALAQLAVAVAPSPRRRGVEGGAASPAQPIVAKKRTTAEQWALVAATDGDLVSRVKATQKALYGEDGRLDWCEAPAEVQEVSASVAALFARRDVVEVGGRYHVMTRPFGEVYFLAQGEAFAAQPCGAFGTAWVLDEHHMVTAGHCVPSGEADDVVCVFGFAMDGRGEVATSFEASQVAFPSAALSSHQLDEEGDGDWAVLRFEEPLPAPPLRLRSGPVEVGEELWMAGYPCGIPLKLAPGALVTRHKNDDRFYATLDAFAGNSGSPVLDAQHQVVGILVRGAEDWQPRRDGQEPRRAQRYPVGASLGEEVMRLDRFVARRPAGAVARETMALGSAGTTTARGLASVRGADARRTSSSRIVSSQRSATASSAGFTSTPGWEAEDPPRARGLAMGTARAATLQPARPRAATDRGIAAPLDAHALLVQIARYPEMPLPEVRDAEDLAAVLADPELCHYPPANITLLRDGEATRDGILAALRQLAEHAGEDSTVLVYFSGHAGLRGCTTYALPFDCDREALARTALSEQQLAAALAPLRAEKVLLIFDCCHAEDAPSSGDDSAVIAAAPPVRPGLPEAVAAALVRGRGWAILTSARAGQRSRVRGEARNGVFAEHLLAGLRGGRPSDDGYLRVMELFEYLQPLVTQQEPAQQPQLCSDRPDSFAIARHRGGAVGVVPRTDDGFGYHALLCYAPADAGFVRDVLLPPLVAAGLRVATTHDVAPPGLHRVLGVARGAAQARATLVVVSQALLDLGLVHDLTFGEGDGSSDCSDHAVLHRRDWELRQRRYGLVPIFIEDPDLLRGAPAWLAALEGVRLGEAAAPHDQAGPASLGELARALQAPAPRR